MGQIIVVSSNRAEAEHVFSKHGFLVEWCPFIIDDIIRIRNRSNILVLCIADEDPDELKRIGFYLRDLCIEEEKLLYLYGKRFGVDLVRARVPSMYVRKMVYAFSAPISVLVEDLLALEQESSRGLPRLLIMDDDIGYVSKLRPYLDQSFRVWVTHGDLAEAGAFVLQSDIVLVSTGARFNMGEFLVFSRTLAAKRRDPSFRLYYIAEDEAERIQFSSGSGTSSVIFSKQTDPARVARYLQNVRRTGTA